MVKKAVIIGFGGMGQRHYMALKKLNITTIAICEKNFNKFRKYQFSNNIKLVKDYKKILKVNCDLICISSNTGSRFKIIKDFIVNSNIKNIITEKPLSTSISKSKEIVKLAKKHKVRLIVNTHRTFSPNFLMIKKIFKKNKENPTAIYINSPSAGLGNMGSTFFDMGNFFFNTKPISVMSWIDKSNTPNPRGINFKDPGGYGVINYKDNKKLFFDLSENTGLPYTITIKSKNLEFIIDEINNKFQYKKRPNSMIHKPLYYYLFKPETKKVKLKHKFDVASMTTYSIKELFKKKFSYLNLINSYVVMECIIACHVSDKTKKLIKLPLSKKFHKLDINFA